MPSKTHTNAPGATRRGKDRVRGGKPPQCPYIAEALRPLAVPIAKLKPDPANVRTHNERNMESIKYSLEKFGQRTPVVANEAGVILAGNARYEVAKALGWSHLAVVYVEDDSKTGKLYALADNRTAELAEWDVNLSAILENLKLDFDMSALWSDNEILELPEIEMPDSGKDPDEVPEIPEKPISKTGDLWLLGRHRLLCGDCTKPEDVERLMNGEKADMVFTDPPYGVDYGKKNRFLNSFQKSGRNLKDIANDMLGKDELFDFLIKAFTLAFDSGKDHCSYYVTAPQGGELGLMMMMMMMMSGLPTRHVLIWNKNRQNFSLGRLDYEYKHEPILFSWKKTHKFYGKGQFKNSVWDIDKELKCDLHPTMKPVALIKNALLNSSKQNDLCLDLFLGSGSTLIAAEELNRRCYAMEIEPRYVDVAVKRWELFTGKKAELAHA